MLVNIFLNEHTEHYTNGGKKYYYAYWGSKANISIEKINNSPVFVPEAILNVYIRGYTQGGVKIFFECPACLFENLKLFVGDPPSHSLECNVVFIICQVFFIKTI